MDISHLKDNPGVKDCCKQEVNLVLTRISLDEVVNKCQVCGCRHFELTVDPGVIGIRGKDLSPAPNLKWY
jgi:hypothetical protein